MLTLLRNEDRLPETLYGVYDRFLSLLLDWEVRKERLPSAATATAALEAAAYAMVERNQTSLLTIDWVRVAGRTVGELRALGVTSGPSAEDILRVVLSTGLLRDLGGEISFSHNTFLEFLAARRILGTAKPAHTDRVALQIGVARFLCGGTTDVTPLLQEHLLHCDDLQAMKPLLREARTSQPIGGGFKTLYDAIMLGEDLGIELAYSMRGPEAEAFGECIDEFVQTCIILKPKALSLLKDAADSVVRTQQWQQSRSWFEQILLGLEAYGWPGAVLHRQLMEMGYFEAVHAFCDDGTDPDARQSAESLFAYLDAVYKDDFANASQHLARVEDSMRRTADDDADDVPGTYWWWRRVKSSSALQLCLPGFPAPNGYLST